MAAAAAAAGFIQARVLRIYSAAGRGPQPAAGGEGVAALRWTALDGYDRRLRVACAHGGKAVPCKWSGHGAAQQQGVCKLAGERRWCSSGGGSGSGWTSAPGVPAGGSAVPQGPSVTAAAASKAAERRQRGRHSPHGRRGAPAASGRLPSPRLRLRPSGAGRPGAVAPSRVVNDRSAGLASIRRTPGTSDHSRREWGGGRKGVDRQHPPILPMPPLGAAARCRRCRLPATPRACCALPSSFYQFTHPRLLQCS